MIAVVKIFSSSVGKKALMALTGSVLFAFLLGHMIGNLQLFIGQDALNNYAKFLHSMPGLLWLVRIGLLSFFCIHIYLAVLLKAENRAARPVAYHTNQVVRASFASRTMILSGLVILSFLVYHILHFTLNMVHPEYSIQLDAQNRPDVYTMVILSFRHPLIAATYLLAMLFLSMHLRHSLQGMFQSMGWNGPRWRELLEGFATVFSTILFVGNAAMPVAVFLHLVHLPGEV